MCTLKDNKVRLLCSKIKNIVKRNTTRTVFEIYFRNFEKYSFRDCHCQSFEQFRASIIRLYHTIEKGLSYENYRAGFGKNNIENLLVSLEQYANKGYDTSTFFYETALSCLYEYLRKNRVNGYEDRNLEERIRRLPGKANSCGGTITISVPNQTGNMNYEELVLNRHSIRHFSQKPLDMDLLKSAINLAQFTPSACNRQGWRTIIITDKSKMEEILANQNGNSGFGQEFDKILVITADLRAQQKEREIFQAFIDGGMYAESVINALYYKGIGSVPLSASLTKEQERNIRKIIRISDAEVLILFVGIGNYPEENFLAARSEREAARIEVI